MQRQPSAFDDGWFDVLVVGGGIYGAWIAYDAALRGLRVAVVEKNDWGAGTSSASSKLIHGGLRYLEYGHIGLVRKTLQERTRLLRFGPHRVWPLRFLMPLTDHSRAGRFAMTMALRAYDALAGRRSNLPRHHFVTRDEIANHQPWAMTSTVRGGFHYSDAGTDDARLTLEIISGAIQAGAVAINHASCSSLERDQQGVVVGGMVHDAITGHSHNVRSRVTVVTAGPWCAQLLGREPGPVHYSKGVHLVMPPLPGSNQQALLLTAPQDRRVFFLIPWYGATLLGTTDTHYEGTPPDVRVEEQDIAYLLKAVTTCCPELGWSPGDIRGSFAGLRTLVGNAGGGVGSVSREWSLIAAEKQLLVSVGGKLTSARIEASQVVDRCLNLLNKPMRKCQTSERLFPWAPTEPWSSWWERTQKFGCQLGLDAMTAAHASRRYGQRIHKLFADLERNPSLAQRIDPRYPFCQGEIAIARQHEMALTDDDVFRRRIPLSLLGGRVIN